MNVVQDAKEKLLAQSTEVETYYVLLSLSYFRCSWTKPGSTSRSTSGTDCSFENHCERTRNGPLVLLLQAAPWFSEVRCGLSGRYSRASSRRYSHNFSQPTEVEDYPSPLSALYSPVCFPALLFTVYCFLVPVALKVEEAENEKAEEVPPGKRTLVSTFVEGNCKGWPAVALNTPLPFPYRDTP